MTLPQSEIAKRAWRLLKSHGRRSPRPEERSKAEMGGVIVVLGEDRSLHVHLTDGEEVGPTIYAELSGGHVTTWNHPKVKEAISKMAAVQVLDDLANV